MSHAKRLLNRGFIPAVLSLTLMLAAAPAPAPAQNFQGGAQQAPQVRRAVPQGWQVYRGPDGLVVFHPHGWRVQRGQENSFLVIGYGPDGQVLAVALMQPVQIDGHSQGVVQGLGQVHPALFPALRVSNTQTLSQQPEVAQGRLDYSAQGNAFRGVAMCFKEGRQGVIYALAGRADQWQRLQPVLRDVLAGAFWANANAGASGGAPTPGLPAMTTWRDPTEGAFTLPVPQGWKVDGGLRRYHAVDTRPEVVVQSPDGSILIRLGDAQVPPMIMPNQMLNMTGFREGRIYDSGYGLKQLVMRYLPGSDFITQYYLPKRVGQTSNVQARPLTELTQQMQAVYSRSGLPIRVDAGEARFETNLGGMHRRGYIFAQTMSMMAPGGNGLGTWLMEKFAGYLAAPGKEAQAEAIMVAMVAGFQVDPQWHARQSQTTRDTSAIVTRTHNEIQGIIHSTFQHRQQVMDRTMERYTRGAIRGTVLIEDPNTGQRYEVPNGSNYYWRRSGTDSVVGTETDTRPQSPNYWFNRMNVLD